MSETHSDSVEYGPQIRYKSCIVFEKTKISYVIWFEDALRHYGVPTALFDLYILLLDLGTAANALVHAGWAMDTQSPHRIADAVVEIPQRPLISPDKRTKTVLLLASDWRFPLASNPPLECVPIMDQLSSSELAYPQLPALLDALIESWLAGPSDDDKLLLCLSCYVNYIYDHVPGVKVGSFAGKVKYEHRQLHADIIAGMESSTLPFRNYQRGIREGLLQSRYELQECSASRDNKVLFVNWESIRLPDPVRYEESSHSDCED
ncbi:hypothetical protein BJX66DRAFT_349382 [Aspergillus keveii]|uniref:Uncharacterized protein n=1 Tax=Aspergillus keveii TaxID=714993 RepID=A0ABR4FJP1_9EURO